MADEKSPAPAGNPWKYMVFGLLGALLLVAGGGGAWLMLNRGKSTAAAAPVAEVKPQPEFTVHLDGFTVNLSDPQENAFLRVTMDLGLAQAPKGDSKGKEGGGGDDSFPTARVRDTVLSVLTACQASELITPEGKSDLKHHLLEALQRDAPEIGVRNVYFTEFLVQR
jgi:flagellar FliL protein